MSTFTGVHGGHFQVPTHHPKRAITVASNHPLRVMSTADTSTHDGVKDE
jgi:hypothetical protein